MFNAKLRKNAIDNYNAAVERYEKAANDLGENTNVLYQERKKALALVKLIEERINQLANTPKEFRVTLQKIEIEVENFKTKQQEIKKAEVEAKAKAAGNKLPGIYNVNWFRRDAEGNFVWPGFGQNMRVLEWIIDRCEGRAEAVETPIGFVPTYEQLNWTGLDFSKEQFETVTAQDKEQWIKELESHTELFNKLGERLPAALKARQAALLEAVKSA